MSNHSKTCDECTPIQAQGMWYYLLGEYTSFLQKISEDIVEKRILMEYYVAAVPMQRKMSIRALAEKSGVAKSHIQKIEAGKASPSLEVMCRLAEALDCDLSELYSYK